MAASNNRCLFNCYQNCQDMDIHVDIELKPIDKSTSHSVALELKYTLFQEYGNLWKLSLLLWKFNAIISEPWSYFVEVKRYSSVWRCIKGKNLTKYAERRYSFWNS